MSDSIADFHPVLATRLSRAGIADLPTAVTESKLLISGQAAPILIKHDEFTGAIYGGNKVRKLEYLLRRAIDRRAERVVTYGTVASNHALATALYAVNLGLSCTCLLSHQAKTPNAPRVLNEHLRIGTELVPFGGSRQNRVELMRRFVQGRSAYLIPPGGSNWLGAVGFVNAGLELAQQITAGEIPEPDRIYVANGTMGTAAGLALGLALAQLSTRVHAVRVTHEFVSNRTSMRRLVRKVATVLHRFDNTVPADLADRVRLEVRDEFFGDGYARSNDATDSAVAVAKDQLDLCLETTYTGKAMAALIADSDRSKIGSRPIMFWNTYNGRPLQSTADQPGEGAGLPSEFRRYFD